jgi:hypothetical protein
VDTVLLRHSRLRVLEGTAGLSMVARDSDNHVSVDVRTGPLPMMEGQARQASSPVMMVEQLGHCQARLSEKFLVNLMCFCTARLRFPSWQTCSSSIALPERAMDSDSRGPCDPANLE